MIPLVGPIAAAVIAGLVAVRSASGIGPIISYAAYAICLRLSIDQLLGPIALGTAARLHPVLIIFCILAGGILFGIIGVILAIPVALVVRSTLAILYDEFRCQNRRMALALGRMSVNWRSFTSNPSNGTAMTWYIGSDLLQLMSNVFIAGAGVGCFYLLVSSMAVLRHQRRDRIPPRSPVPVTILKPLHGVEPRLAERLASFCDQTYGAPVQLVCGIQDPADQAIAAVMQVVDANPLADITLKIDGHQHGSNRKISNLANILPLARHETLVIADSDIEVGPNYLATITANLAQSGVGAVTCLYHGVGGPGPWSQLAALAINAHFLPNVVSAVSFGLAQPCFGSTVAMSRATLSRIGGLETVANCLADDYAIGAAVREAGLKVAIPSFSVAHVCFETSLHGLLTHELRAMRTIKTIDRLGYCGTIIEPSFADWR